MLRLPMEKAWKDPASRRGSLLVDALLAVVIFGAVVAAFSTGIYSGSEGTNRAGNRVRAVYLANEGLEVVRTIRDDDNPVNPNDGYALIAALSPGVDHAVSLTAGNWGIAPGTAKVDGMYTRAIQFVPGANPNERITTSTVSWTDAGGQQSSTIAKTVVTNWHTNPPPPPPDWSTAWVEASVTLGANCTDIKGIAVKGNVAYVTCDHATDGFIVVNITNPAAPVPVSYTDIVDFTGPPKRVAINGNYAYVGMDQAVINQLQIVDLTVPSRTQQTIPGLTGIFGLVSNGTTLSLAKGNDGTDNEYFEYDIAGANAGSPVLNAGRVYDFGGLDTRSLLSISINGNYAYFGSDTNPTEEVTVLDINANPPTKPVPGGGNIPTISGTAEVYATAILTSPLTLYAGTRRMVNSTAIEQLFAFDLSTNPADLPPVGANDRYRTAGDDNTDNGNINEIVVLGDPPVAFLATNAANVGPPIVYRYFQAVNLSNPLDISDERMENLDMEVAMPTTPNGAEAIAYRESDHRVFVGGGAYFVVLCANNRWDCN